MWIDNHQACLSFKFFQLRPIKFSCIGGINFGSFFQKIRLTIYFFPIFAIFTGALISDCLFLFQILCIFDEHFIVFLGIFILRSIAGAQWLIMGWLQSHRIPVTIFEVVIIICCQIQYTHFGPNKLINILVGLISHSTAPISCLIFTLPILWR